MLERGRTYGPGNGPPRAGRALDSVMFTLLGEAGAPALNASPERQP